MAAAQVGLKAARGDDVCVAGSVGPLRIGEAERTTEGSIVPNVFGSRSPHFTRQMSI